MPTNSERTEWAAHALDIHLDQKGELPRHHLWGEEVEGPIIDLITDLLHLAEAHDLDTDAILRMATFNYEAERGV